MKKETITYAHNSQSLLGHLAYKPSDKPLPAVLVCHAWGGKDQFANQKAEYLAELGYVGFALDIYGDGKTGSSNEENSKLMAPFLQDRELLKGRILAAYEKVKGLPMVDPGKLGAIGFCFGGLCALDLARSGADIKGVVSFHGILKSPEIPQKSPIKAKILALHGYDDPMGPPAQVQEFAKEMTSSKADWQIHLYGNTTHAFTNPLANDKSNGLVYNKTSENRSFTSMENFFQEIFS